MTDIIKSAIKAAVATNPFSLGVKSTKISGWHIPLIWENMLGTVYACNPSTGEVKYFDYNVEAAIEFIRKDDMEELIVANSVSSGDGIKYPRMKQTALWGIYRPRDKFYDMFKIWEANIGFSGGSPLVLVKADTAASAKTIGQKAVKLANPNGGAAKALYPPMAIKWSLLSKRYSDMTPDQINSFKQNGYFIHS